MKITHHQMATTRVPPAATVILSSLFILLLSTPAAATSWSQLYTGRRHQRQNSTTNVGLSGPRNRHTGMMRATARQFLDAHNRVRLAKGMPPLLWDPKLARYARRYGLTRKADCNMIHSNGEYGENLFWGGKDHWKPSEVVKSWADEQEFYDVMSNTCRPNEMCGHYTQIVWKDTTKVGCARQKCDTGGLLVICSYDPPGNYVGEHPFGAPPSGHSQGSPSPPPPSSSSSPPPPPAGAL